MWTYRQDEQAAANPLGGYRGIIGTTQTIASATAADVTGIAFPIKSSESWIFEMDLYAVGNTNGLAFSFTGPASPSLVLMNVFGNTSGITAVSSEVETAFATPTSVAFAAAAVANYIRIRLTVVNGITAGTVQLQCSTVSGANSSTLVAGSSWTAIRTA